MTAVRTVDGAVVRLLASRTQQGFTSVVIDEKVLRTVASILSGAAPRSDQDEAKGSPS